LKRVVKERERLITPATFEDVKAFDPKYRAIQEQESIQSTYGLRQHAEHPHKSVVIFASIVLAGLTLIFSTLQAIFHFHLPHLVLMVLRFCQVSLAIWIGFLVLLMLLFWLLEKPKRN
jgi:hypothetical protein